MTCVDRKTVLFFPLNSPGHINSSLGIADRLKRDHDFRTVFLLLGSMIGNDIKERGHELVTLDEVSPYEDFDIGAEGEGDEKSEAGEKKLKFEGVFKWPRLLLRYQKLFRLDPIEAFCRSAEIMERNMVSELLDNHSNCAAAIDEINPDLIVIDAYYVPPCVMTRPQTPWARLYSANPLQLVQSKLAGALKPPPMTGFQLFDKQTRQQLRDEQPQKWAAILESWKSATEQIIAAMGKAGSAYADFLRDHNCPPVEFGKQAPDSPHLNIYMYPKVLDFDQDDDLFYYPPRWFRCDSLMRTEQASQDEINLWRGKLEEARVGRQIEEVVFFSLGSLASGDVVLMKKFVDFLGADTNERRLYVISKGVNGDRYELKSKNMIGANYVPQAFLLQQVDLAIIHGGNNTITECMFYGVPSIVMPVFADQFDNAQRLDDLKLGKRLNIHTCSCDELNEAVNCLLANKELKRRLKTISAQMQRCDDVGRVASLLKQLAEEKKLDEELLRR